MAKKIAFQLIPLDGLSSAIFDLSRLPFSITPEVEVADVSQLLPASMFQYLRDEGRHRMRFFEGTVKHAFVHRYDDTPTVPYENSVQIRRANEQLLNEVFACSRIVRPTRRHGSVTGYINENGTIDPRETSFPDTAMDVPEALKLFAFRNQDLEVLRTIIDPFLEAMHGEYWAFRMAVQYYYMGYEVNDWKGRFLYQRAISTRTEQ